MRVFLDINFTEIERKWQERWKKDKVFEPEVDPSKPKFFITVAYPYPNSPQHVGHGRTYTLTDVHARYMRMKGYNVLFPMGFHYTGTPILAMSKRLSAGDEELYNLFTRLYGVPEEHVKTFNEPLNIARYFHQDLKQGMIEMGFSIDWRREFTTIDPHYNKFIEWQFKKLHQKGLISKGSHPVGWCPSCGNPVGQHDTKGDVEPEIEEFTAIKFKLGDTSILTGTLRPETIFGVTNIWINPEADYVEAEVDGEKWIISEVCAKKLVYQHHVVKILKKFKGTSLVGKEVENPVTKERIPVLPASFVDPANVTGIVMSVPAHAPYDYLALMDLLSNKEELARFNLTYDLMTSIKPKPIIKVDELGEIPAKSVIEMLGVKTQHDPKAEDATREVYSKEYHFGVMRDNTGKYSGMRVSEAKGAVKKDLISSGLAVTIYEIVNRPVYCRCGAEVIVKVLKDQWFINYNDPHWKELTYKCLNTMSIVPEELRQEFKNVIDWLKEKACARKSGLGTKLPWDQEWIIESLSDSTIYMAFYTIARIINELHPPPEAFTEELFDYVFLGIGDLDQLSKSTGLPAHVIERMREEFSYYYPLDCRHSGRDLVPNHLTFFIFNHVAIFPEQLWPRQIVVNGSVLMEGKKMSKSLGNIIPLRKAIAMYGADTVRLAVLSTAELLQDADFSDALAKSIKEHLKSFYSMIIEFSSGNKQQVELNKLTLADRWILHKLQQLINKVTIAMDNMRYREALHLILYAFKEDINWYLRRASSSAYKTSILRLISEVLVKLLAPFAPHICEELWEKMGMRGYVSLARWPTIDQSLLDYKAELSEYLVKTVIEDTSEILKVTGIQPKHVYYYIAPTWHWQILNEVLKLSKEGKLDVKAIIRQVISKPEIKTKGGEAAKAAQKIVQHVQTLSPEIIEALSLAKEIDEHKVLVENTDFISSLFKCRIHILKCEEKPLYDPRNKAQYALPLKPAIYIE